MTPDRGRERKGTIGVDEAGRGPVMGPLVVAAVRVLDEKALKKMGVRDSKDLSRDRREVLFSSIKEVADVSTVVLSAEDIDEKRKIGTMNQIEMELFANVIRTLARDGDKVFVDAADVREAFFGETIARVVGGDLEIVSEHKADTRYPVVSAASIMAKVTRDRLMGNIEEDLRKRLDQPLGSGYPSDRVTITFMENWIKQEGNLPPHTRRSWKTSKTLLSKAMTKTLDEFGSHDDV